MIDFWRWAASDLISNTLRGQFAEFLVATALDAADGVRQEWDDVDVRLPSGRSIEVKSASYVQTWQQQRPSRIEFSIAPTYGWNAETNEYHAELGRRADVYVFCLLGHPASPEVEPLELTEWRFFVLSTHTLEEQVPGQKTIALARLVQLGAVEAAYADLAHVVRTALSARR